MTFEDVDDRAVQGAEWLLTGAARPTERRAAGVAPMGMKMEWETIRKGSNP